MQKKEENLLSKQEIIVFIIIFSLFDDSFGLFQSNAIFSARLELQHCISIGIVASGVALMPFLFISIIIIPGPVTKIEQLLGK